jgi:hypothetical protein
MVSRCSSSLSPQSPLFLPQMPQSQRRYSATGKARLSSSELVCKSLDHDATDLLIDKWLEHRNDAYWDWFHGLREKKHAAVNGKLGQLLVWNKGEFIPENVFCRTVDTGRLIPLDRTWTTHVYHHRSMMERKLSMMPVVFTMVRGTLWYLSTRYPNESRSCQSSCY